MLMSRSLAPLLCGTLLVLLISLPAQAQSAVSVSLNGVYGYVFEAETIEAAIHNAHAQCFERGGKDCWTLIWSERDGYGAIAISPEEDGDLVFGAGLGFDTPDAASLRAREECARRGGVSCEVQHTWLDPQG